MSIVNSAVRGLVERICDDGLRGSRHRTFLGRASPVIEHLGSPRPVRSASPRVHCHWRETRPWLPPGQVCSTVTDSSRHANAPPQPSQADESRRPKPFRKRCVGRLGALRRAKVERRGSRARTRGRVPRKRMRSWCFLPSKRLRVSRRSQARSRSRPGDTGDRSAARVAAKRPPPAWAWACASDASTARPRSRPRRGLRPTPTAKQPVEPFGSTRTALQPYVPPSLSPVPPVIARKRSSRL